MSGEFTKENIEISHSAALGLNHWLDEIEYSSLFILCDHNTRRHCLPVLLQEFPELAFANLYSIEPGEQHKNLESLANVWEQLSKKSDRKSILINLGGGVVSDLGGFAASCFKRGIRFVNIPTSLLAMVDAAIGGKTGIDFKSLKNEIGTFAFAEKTFIDPQFLASLPERELRSGYAEMLKHGLIDDPAYFEDMGNLNPEKLTTVDWMPLIKRSIEIKSKFILSDPFEKNIRAALNFGHSIAHALESSALGTKGEDTLLHGEAVAAGMMMEAFISKQLCGLNKTELDKISSTIRNTYPMIHFNEDLVARQIQFDKKNIDGTILMSLLKRIGVPEIRIACNPGQIMDAFSWYKKEYQS